LSVMAYAGPSYGLSAELKQKQEAKYDPEEAKKCLSWINQVTSAGLDVNKCRTDDEFAELLKDGQALCKLINAIAPGSVGRINTMSATFKQRENIEMYLAGCSKFGLIESDLFQVNDLYEMKNVYMVIDNCYSLSGLAQKKGWRGPSLGVKHASQNKREFDEATLNAGKNVISLQYGSNQGASQTGMVYGSNRPINPSEFVDHDLTPKNVNLQGSGLAGLQYGSNQCASQAGNQAGSAFGNTRPIMASEFVGHDLKPSNTRQQTGGLANLQMGTNTGASQAGSTAFGSSRPINPSEFVGHALKPNNSNHQTGGLANLQYGSNAGASQAGSTAFGTSRPINPSEFVGHDLKPSNANHQSSGLANLQYGSNAGASQAGSTAFGTSRPINPAEFMKK